MSLFQDIVTAHDNYDFDKDGTKEIEALRFLSFENPSTPIDTSRKLVVVIAEKGLFANLAGSRYTPDQLLSRLQTLKRDLLREGRQSMFLEMKVYSGPDRQDGKTLLAIRDLFKSIRTAFPCLEGALLVGAFPEASIVRNWPQHVWDPDQQYRVGLTPGEPRRFEIVLADLDGNWDKLYHSTVAVDQYFFKFGPSTSVSEHGSRVIITNPQIEKATKSRRDVFYIPDADYTISGDSTRVELDMNCVDPEVSAQDKLRPNPVARPDICVSRINARNIAVRPPSPRLLDTNGKPQATPNVPTIDFSAESWTHDADLERTLLIDYFDRNHAFRAGQYSDRGFSVILIESKIGKGAAEEGLDGFNQHRDETPDATLLDLTRWLKRPATFRVVATHANSHETELRPNDPDAALVESECGGHPWRWVDMNGKYVPSFSGYSNSDLHLYRTLWENQQFAGVSPSLMMHLGCDVNIVDHAETVSYSDPRYGTFQNAESFLFYGNQLAVICRATWWFRGPVGFGTAFGASASAVMGDGWRGTSERLSQDAGLASQTTERKQNYIWSVVGDWTLQKYYPTWPYGHRIDLSDSTPESPAACSFNKRLYVFWKANDSGNRIYYCASADGLNWPASRMMNSVDSTPGALSACEFRNKLYVFWNANDSGRAILYSASADGATWPSGRTINNFDTTPKPVSACVFNNQLYLFWKSNDPNNRIYYSASKDGVTWPRGKQIDSSDSTPEPPAACVFDGKLYVFWKANDPGNRIFYSASADGVTWPASRQIDDYDSTPKAVAPCVFNGQLYLFWKENDRGNRIYCTGSAGVKWPNAHKINDYDSTPQAPAACTFDNQIYLLWKSNDSGNWIYYSTNDVSHRV